MPPMLTAEEQGTCRAAPMLALQCKELRKFCLLEQLSETNYVVYESNIQATTMFRTDFEVCKHVQIDQVKEVAEALDLQRAEAALRVLRVQNYYALQCISPGGI
jgi:hypothetical protein